jgi:hydrogenase-4 component B
VPPLNGFASKWLLYATAILGGRGFPLFVVLGVIAMFISLVTLASFLKYVGGVFLGTPRAPAGVREVPLSMTLPQIVLIGICVFFGLVPLWPLRFIHAAIAGLVPEAPLPALASILPGGFGLRIAADFPGAAVWSPLPVAAALVVIAVLVYTAIQRAGGATVRRVPVWACGEDAVSAGPLYPATSFYLPFKRAFHGIYPTRAVRAPVFPPWLRRTFELDSWLYRPAGRAVDRVARAFSRTHVGIPQIYLLWIVVGAVSVIVVLLAIVS